MQTKNTTKDLNIALHMEKIQATIENAKDSVQQFMELAGDTEQLREWAQQEVTKYAMSVKTAKIDQDELENFFQYPYVILPGKHEGEYYLAIPKFVDVQFGWLEKVTPSYNIFLVNKYVDWLGGIPQALKDELKFPDPLDIYLDGDHLVGNDMKKAKEKYGQFVKRKEKDGRLLVDKARHFDLLAALIKDGILPFVPKPVAREDYIDRKCDFKLRPYQEECFADFLKYSNIGAFLPPSTGKTFLGLYAMTHVKGPWLIVVPSRLLVEQWKERIELYTDLEPDEYDVMTYYAGVKKDRQYKGKIIDEVHHMPSNEFSKLAMVKTDFTIGLSATPQREDNREEYIFALTGKPTGMNWEYFKQMKIIANPPLHCHIVKSDNARLAKVQELLQEDLKTIIFADSIDMGKTYAKKFNIPHVYGDTKSRLDKIQENQVTIVSRVGDEGVSLPDIKRVIEISWLHGSRRQELQRFTRLLHGKGTDGEGHIIMTVQEYQKDHKRLFGIMDKGFKIMIHRDGISDKVIEKVKKPASKKIIKSAPKASKDTYEIKTQHPVLSLPGIKKKLLELNKTEKMIVELLYQREKEEFTKEGLGMLLGLSATGGAFRAALTHIKKLKLVTSDQGKWKADLSLMGLAKA